MFSFQEAGHPFDRGVLRDGFAREIFFDPQFSTFPVELHLGVVKTVSLAVQCRIPLKHMQFQRGAATRAEPTKSQGTPRSPWQNVLGYCFICIDFELCLWSIVGSPGSCAYPYVSECSAKGKGRTTAIVLPVQLVKCLRGESQKLTITISVNWSAIR